MANQRKKGSKLIGAYVNSKVKSLFNAEAKRTGLTEADLLRKIIEDRLEKSNTPPPPTK